MSNQFEDLRNNILNYSFTVLSLDIGGGGVKMGVYKVNPILRIPLLISTVKQFSVKGEKTLENVFEHFQKKIKSVTKIDFVCTSMSSTEKIFKNWRSMSKNNKEEISGAISNVFTKKYGLKYFEKNDVFCHSLACRSISGILDKKISSVTFVFGTSPSLIVIDENGEKVEKSGGLIKNKGYLWQTFLNQDLGSSSCTKYPPKNNQNRSSCLDNWSKENKFYFFKVWNKLLKPIFISGGNKYLNGWTGKAPKFIFMAGGMSQYRLSGYIGVMNNWLQSSSNKYKNTQIVLAPRNSGLIGASCLPFFT